MSTKDKNAQSLVKFENELYLINSTKLQSENCKEMIEEKKILFPETPAQIEMEILINDKPYLFTISEKGNAMPYKKEFKLNYLFLKWASVFMIQNNERTKINDINFKSLSKDDINIIFIWDQRNLRYAIKEKNESCYSKCQIILNNVSLLPNQQKQPLINCTPYDIRTKKCLKDQYNEYKDFYIDVFKQGIQFPCQNEIEFFNTDVKISKNIVYIPVYKKNEVTTKIKTIKYDISTDFNLKRKIISHKKELLFKIMFIWNKDGLQFSIRNFYDKNYQCFTII